MGINMPENESSKFKIGPDDNPDSIFMDEFQGLKLDKLNRRITLITILIPCLIGAIVFLAYRDINTRVGQVSYSGAAKVQTLSKDLEKRFSSLSNTQKDLSQKLASLEKTTTAMQKNLKEATTAIKYIRVARRSDNKKISNAINTINKTLTPIPQDLEKIAADIKIVNDKSTKELENFSQSLESINNNLIKIEANLISMASAKIDQKTLDTALKKQEEKYQKLLRQTSNDIDKKIVSLERKIQGKKSVKAPSDKTVTSSQKSSKPGPAQETDKPEPAPQEKTAQNTTLPKPGTFIEQDIK